MRQEHVVVITNPDGRTEIYPLKEWLRSHSDHLPSGMSATDNTSHELRAALKRKGWKMEESSSQVRLLMPSNSQSSSAGNDIFIGDDISNDEQNAQLPVFSLEYQLRDFLATNLNTISVNGKKLRLFVDPVGRDGVEFQTDVGFIDVLAIDNAGAFYVFELKRGRSSDYVLGQITRYMGWVKQTIGRNVDVFGVIVSKEINSQLRYAASVVPNIHLFEYEINFQLKPAHDIGQ